MKQIGLFNVKKKKKKNLGKITEDRDSFSLPFNESDIKTHRFRYIIERVVKYQTELAEKKLQEIY